MTSSVFPPRLRAGLAVAAAAFLTMPAVPAAPVARATVVLTSHRFTPSPIHLSGGVPVRLTILNQSGDSHDFTAPEFFYWSKIRGRAIPGGKIRLRPGQRAIVTLTPRRGSYKLKCSRFGHAFLGMSTMIIVH